MVLHFARDVLQIIRWVHGKTQRGEEKVKGERHYSADYQLEIYSKKGFNVYILLYMRCN